MTDREKLLKLWQDIRAIELPKMSTKPLQILVNTVESGLNFIKDWLVDEFKNQ
jgi:hypothetical protein